MQGWVKYISNVLDPLQSPSTHFEIMTSPSTSTKYMILFFIILVCEIYMICYMIHDMDDIKNALSIAFHIYTCT